MTDASDLKERTCELHQMEDCPACMRERIAVLEAMISCFGVAEVLRRIAKERSSDPVSDDLTVPLAIELAARQSDLAKLKDPTAVHLNMLRGEIAKPSWEQIEHLYPREVGDLKFRCSKAIETAEALEAQLAEAREGISATFEMCARIAEVFGIGRGRASYGGSDIAVRIRAHAIDALAALQSTGS